MDRKWMNKTLLALSIQMVFGVAYAAEEPQLGEYETTAEQAEVSDTAVSTEDTSVETNSAVVAATATNGAQAASSALQQQEGDATKEANLEEVFTSNERQYSLMKQGEIHLIMILIIPIIVIHSSTLKWLKVSCISFVCKKMRPMH